jgi:hypothetical protein
MKRIALLLPAAFLIALLSAAYSQSLADIAKKEKERREGIKDNRVISDEEVAKYQRESAKSAPTADQPPDKTDAEKKEGEVAGGDQKDEADSDEPKDLEGRTEGFWRKAMADARQKVKDLTNEANVIVLRIAELQNKFYSMDDGFNRETVQRDIQKSFYEQDRNKEDLEKAKAELTDLEKEARKSGALPGWLEPGK